MTETRIHYNYPQIRSMLVAAPEEWAVMARATGKTIGILAYKSANCYLSTMPRGCGVAVGTTYAQLLGVTLKSLVAGWEMLGYKRDVHYVIGTRPPKEWIARWKWEGPFYPTLKWEYFISWWNGAGIHLVSQDRNTAPNGISIDWIIGDEAKLLNREKLVRGLFPANRGRRYEWRNNPYHHGKTFTTDMPTGTAGQWILEKELEMDKPRVAEILKLQKVRYELVELSKKSKNKILHAEIKKQCQVLDDEINEQRMAVNTKGNEKPALLYYHEASTLDNIHALGFEYIKEQLRDSTLYEFDTQIMNIRPKKIQDGFYPDFDEEKHGYFSYNYNFIDKLGYDFDLKELNNWRKDGDHDPHKPLDISGDWNKKVWPLTVAQDYDKELRIINAFHVEYPLKLVAVLKKFSDYYSGRPNKDVRFWYDHTAVGELDDTPIYLKVQTILTELGWDVQLNYIKQSSTFYARFLMYDHFLKEDGYYNKVLRVNRDNAAALITSINLAGSRIGPKGIEKDKRPEKDPKANQVEATHFSESLDVLTTGMLERRMSDYNADAVPGIITI